MKKIADDRVLSYIEGHLEGFFGAEEIAKEFGYSPDHFRHLFRTCYGTSMGEYIRRRRLVKAAEMIQNGKAVTDVALKYGFDTPAGFSKAFRKAFGFPASEVKNQKDIFLDEIPHPTYDRDLIKVSCVEIPELKTVGRQLLPKKVSVYDMFAQAACWLDFEELEINREDVIQMDDMIGMFYHDPSNVAITYLLGPVVKDFKNISADWVPVTIPGHRYAIFETKRISDKKELAKTIRMLCNYIMWEWVPGNSIKKDIMGFTFERYRRNKVAIYLPIL